MVIWKTIVCAKIMKNTQTSFIVAFGDLRCSQQALILIYLWVHSLAYNIV